ncbi:hypothetical protein TNCV_4685381 [Trichonephila clavipes]|nr:hypothetical protein TNCV_4685381 [Trichonephila clavipes]
MMPLSRMENTTFAMPSIILSRYGIEDCFYSPDAQRKTPIQRFQTVQCSTVVSRVVKSDRKNQDDRRPLKFTVSNYTRAFGDGSCNFQPWSSNEDDIFELAPLPNYPTTPYQREDDRVSTDLTCNLLCMACLHRYKV